MVSLGVIGVSLGIANREIRIQRGYNFNDYNFEGHGVYMIS